MCRTTESGPGSFLVFFRHVDVCVVATRGLWCTLALFLQTGRLDKIKTVTHLPVLYIQFIRSQWEEGGQQTAAAELDVSIPVPSATFVGDRFHWKIGLEGSCVMTVLLDFNFDFDFDFA